MSKISFFTLIIAIAAIVPFFIKYEQKTTNSKEIVVISVMIALAVAGRFLFAAIPGFKPVTAIVVITAIYFGAKAGFLTGSMAALLSNFYFGQGAWTPVQMLVWGFIGIFAAILSKPLLKSKFLLCIYGIFSGVIFSLLMDLWTVIWLDNGINLNRYLALIVTSLPFMAIYAISNVIFLLILYKPIGKKIERIKTKYGFK